MVLKFCSLVTLDMMDLFDYAWLTEWERRDPLGRKVSHFIKKLENKELVLWRWDDGIFMTYVADHGEVRELYVDVLIGRGLSKQIDNMVHDLKEIAKFFQCQIVGATILSPTFAKKLTKKHAVPVGVYGVFHVM